MKHCYHTHTYRCRHAVGTEEEYVKKAISEGLSTLGFSDHTPHPFRGGFVSHCRMEMWQIGDYFDTLLALREKYSGYIDIKIGFETEYYPSYHDELIEIYRSYPLDYLILAGHYVGDEDSPDCFCGFDTTESEDKLVKYTDSLIRAMQTGRFSALAHPDILNFVGDRDLYREHTARLVREAKRLSIPLEINLNGMREGRIYPREDFWQIAGWLGADAFLGCDAHKPREIADKREVLLGQRFADRHGVNLVDRLELVVPTF